MTPEEELEAALKELAEAEAELERILTGTKKRGRPRGSKKVVTPERQRIDIGDIHVEFTPPPKPKARKRAKRRVGHGYWPVTAKRAWDDETGYSDEGLERVLPAAPAKPGPAVITKHLDATVRPEFTERTTHGERCFCDEC